MADDIDPIEPSPQPSEEIPDDEAALVHKIQARIKGDKKFHSKAFKQMREDMFVARNGHLPSWPASYYKANFVGQHVRQKTASLYAKNPKVRARRRDRIEFVLWDEDPQSLQLAFQTVALAQQMLKAAPAQADPITGEVVPAVQPPPEQVQAFQTAQATIADFQQGMQTREAYNRIGRTLELLYDYFLKEQKPIDFKTGAKKLVRRACTTGVGYLELGFQREYGPSAATANALADAQARLAHIQRLMDEAREGEIEDGDADMAELALSIEALQSEPEVIVREGLVINYPESTRVIPDRLTRAIVGFIGSRHLTLEYLYTADQVKEEFGVDVGNEFTAYSAKESDEEGGVSPANYVADDEDMVDIKTGPKSGLVCVWKHYEKASGLVYYLADGHKSWLRAPAPPDVFVEDFWPVYALTFNDIEDENNLFPPSDVRLLIDQQEHYNKARQGQADHREAARPRWAAARGAFSDQDVAKLQTLPPFHTALLDIPPEAALSDVLQAIPISGVDPNLYETNQFMTDTQMTVGSQAANFGGITKATATESAISANATNSSDQSSIDDLDGFLTVVARSGGQILMREMSEEKVKEIVGPGALWPHQSLSEIVNEIYLEVEAGSTGKPNQAVEVQNFKELAPLIMQIPGIKPARLAQEAIRRLDDRLDLTEFMETGAPAIVAQNRAAGSAAPAQPQAEGGEESNPAAQGEKGSDNGPPPPRGEGGSEPAFGSNQV